MDQIDRLVFAVTGRDQGGSKVLSDAAAKADAAHQSMSKLGSTLSGLGGPFEQLTNLASQLGSALEGNAGKAQKLGLGLTAAGVALVGVAARDQQAQRQLQQAIDNTGASYSDYRGEIEDTIKRQEGNARAAHDTQEALTVLVTATQDVTKATSEMNLVSDIAAYKHESLAEAAQQLVLMQQGNTRAFRAFGITLDSTKDRASETDKALRLLTNRIAGQAPAAVDTFVGRLKVMETHLHDEVAMFGEKYGPAITIAGAALTAVASVTQIVIQKKIADSLATANETRAELANAAARTRTAEAAGLEAAAIQRATIAQSEGAAIGAAMAGGLGAGLSTRAILGRLGRAGGYAIGGQVVGSMVGGRTGSAIGDAGIGAGIGSLILPGIGTAVGAGAGALIGGFGAGSHGLSAAQQQQLNQAARTTAGYQKLQAQLAKYQQVAKQTSGPVHDLAEKEIASTKAALDAGQATHEYATSLLKEKQASDAAKNSLQGHLTALADSVGKTLSLSSAEDDLQASMHNMAQAAHDGGRALKGHTAAAEANRNAIRDAVSKMLALIQAEKDAGVSGDKVKASAEAMATALEQNATQIYGNKSAVDALLRSIGVMPSQIQAAIDALNQLHSAAASFNPDSGFRHNPGAGYVPPATDKKAKDYGKHVADQVVSGYAPAVDSGVASATSAALDKAKQKADQQAQYMHTVLSQISGAYQNTKQSLIDSASLANRQQGTDLLGATGPAQSILASKRQFAHQMIHFAHLLRRLEDAHYRPIIIDEVEGLGTVAGIEAAKELLAGGPKERRAVNRAEDRIQRASARISSQITSTDYESEILKALQKLPDQFDRKFEHTLRKLHIVTDTGKQDRKQGRKVRAH